MNGNVNFKEPPFFDRLTIYVIVSLILIILSGLIQRKTGLVIKKITDYSQTYKILHLIKFILTGFMLIFIILRQKMRLKEKKEKLRGEKIIKYNKKRIFPILINSSLALIILIISGIMAAI